MLWIGLIACLGGATIFGTLALEERGVRTPTMVWPTVLYLVGGGLCAIAVWLSRESIAIDKERIAYRTPSGQTVVLRWSEVTGLVETTRGFEVQSAPSATKIRLSRQLSPFHELLELLFLYTAPGARRPRPPQFTLRTLFLLILLVALCMGSIQLVAAGREEAAAATAFLSVVWGGIYLRYRLFVPFMVLCSAWFLTAVVLCMSPVVMSLDGDYACELTETHVDIVMFFCLGSIIVSVLSALVATATSWFPQEW